MFLSWRNGDKKRTFKNVAKRYCTHCQMERFFSILYTRGNVEFFGAVDFDYKKTFELLCTVCNRGYELSREGAEKLVTKAGLSLSE